MESNGRIFRGPENWQISDVSLGQYLLDSMRTDKDHVFQVTVKTGACLSNGDILEQSVKLASILSDYGVNIGDRVTVASENHPNWMMPVCATLYLGAVIAPLNPSYTEREFRHMLEISKPRIIFVSRRTEKLLIKIAATLNWPTKIIELDEESLDKNVPTLKQLLDRCKTFVKPDEFVPVHIADKKKHAAIILYSSGTTGMPKGVTLSQWNLLMFLSYSGAPRHLDIRRNDKILIPLPQYHGYAMGLMIMSMARGSTAYVMQSFEPKIFLESIGKYKITHLPLVPPILVFLAKYPGLGDYDFRSVRELICGAAPLAKDVADEVKKRLNIRWIKHGYGMTELSIVISMTDRSDDGNGTVGYLVPNCLCKVIDQVTHETLGAGQSGELCVKGDQVMLGYYGNPEATAQTIDEDGWLHTGDLGYFDEEERLYITGRLKELIKYKAFQVSPTEIETVILSHPGVKDAAVVGKPDEVSGELPMAFVVPQPASSVSANDIVKYVNDNVSPEKRLRGGVQFIEAIPKNPTGKILRRELMTMVSKL